MVRVNLLSVKKAEDKQDLMCQLLSKSKRGIGFTD